MPTEKIKNERAIILMAKEQLKQGKPQEAIETLALGKIDLSRLEDEFIACAHELFSQREVEKGIIAFKAVMPDKLNSKLEQVAQEFVKAGYPGEALSIYREFNIDIPVGNESDLMIAHIKKIIERMDVEQSKGLSTEIAETVKEDSFREALEKDKKFRKDFISFSKKCLEEDEFEETAVYLLKIAEEVDELKRYASGLVRYDKNGKAMKIFEIIAGIEETK